jgi:hypothetical protein
VKKAKAKVEVEMQGRESSLNLNLDLLQNYASILCQHPFRRVRPYNCGIGTGDRVVIGWSRRIIARDSGAG